MNIKMITVFATLLGLSTTSIAAPISGQGTWETTLLARDFDGDTSTIDGYYDTVLDITWLADANYAQTTGYSSNGLMNWYAANAWAAGLDLDGIAGPDGWRLPIMNPIDGTTLDDANLSYIGTEDRGNNVSAPGTRYAGSTASEMAHLFYNTLGNLGFCDPALSTTTTCSSPQAGYGLSNTGPFSNLQPGEYWSATEFAPISNRTVAWAFEFDRGNQFPFGKTGFWYAWAVHSGDVGASIIPVPAAVWLFSFGLLSLIGVARRKKA